MKKWRCHVQLFATPWTVACQAPPGWDFPGKNTGMGCHFLLQQIFPTQGSNPSLLHWTQTLYCLSHQEIPKRLILYYPACSEKKIILPWKETMSSVKLNYAQYRWASQVAQWQRICLLPGDIGLIRGSGELPGEGKTIPSHILAWKTSWTGEPGGLQSMGLQGVEHNLQIEQLLTDGNCCSSDSIDYAVTSLRDLSILSVD